MRSEEATSQQSPIDLTDDALPAPHDLDLQYAPTPLAVVNDGYTIRVDCVPGSSLVTGGRRFSLLQFHFHGKSEHTVNGEAAAMELHLVHQDSAGDLAVVGVLMTAGRHHEALQRIWRHMPAQAGEKRLVAEEAVNASELLPADLSYYSYTGSLTTPPYTEGVLWFVLSATVEISPEQIARFGAIHPQNARATQPLNGRTVSFSREAE